MDASRSNSHLRRRNRRSASFLALLLSTGAASTLALAAAPAPPSPGTPSTPGGSAQQPAPSMPGAATAPPGGASAPATVNAPPPRIVAPNPPPVETPLNPPLAGRAWLPVTLGQFPPNATRPVYSIVNYLRVEEQVTDNARLTAANKDWDLISTSRLETAITGQTRRSQFSMAGTVSYQNFLSNQDFGLANVGLRAFGQVELLKRLAFADAHAAISDIQINPFGAGATARATPGGQTRATTYDAAGFITPRLFNLIETLFRARRSHVEFNDIGPGGGAGVLTEATLDQLSGYITTSTNEVRKWQMTVTGEDIRQGDTFHLYNGIYSLYAGEPNGIQAVGRFGYENISDPGITDLQGIIWSAGVIARPKGRSYIRVEFGERYNKPTWDGNLSIALTPKLFVTGTYLRTLETLQARIHRSLTDITGQPTDPSLPVPNLPFPILLTLVNGTYLADDINAGVIYLIDPVDPKSVRPGENVGHAGEFLVLDGTHSKRRNLFTGLNDNTQSYTARYGRELNRTLNLGIELGYGKSLQTSPPTSANQSYRVAFSLSYALTKRTEVTGTYSWARNAPDAGAAVTENVLGIRVIRRL